MMNLEAAHQLQERLFLPEEEMVKSGVPEPTRRRLMRLRAMYTLWLSDPRMGDKNVAHELMARYGIKQSVAYDDVRMLKVFIGNLNQGTEDWYRWLFIQRCEEGFKMARQNGDANAFARVLASLGKYTRLDKDKSEAPDYSQIVPQSFDITDNPEDAGYKRIPNLEERIKKITRSYVHDIEDVSFESIKPIGPEINYDKTNKTHQ